MTVMTVVAMAMATAAASTTAAAIATAAAAVAAVAGNGSLLTADQGDADDREKHRDAQNQNTVHPRILQQVKQVPWRNKRNYVPSSSQPAWDGTKRGI
jgi:hypothetical protein